MLIWIIGASALSGIVALLLAVGLLRSRLWSHERSHLFLSFAAGTLMSVAFLDLLPEGLEAAEEAGVHATDGIMLVALVGFLLFFSIEKLILWYHCHEEHCDVHTSSSMVLLGDALHNFIDGVAIAVAFMISIPVGIATTIAVFVHEIPQEVADFGVLLHSGMSPKRAIAYNVLSALASLLGAVLTYLFASAVEGVTPFLMALTAGGFIYIAAADILPEIHKERRRRQMVFQLLIFLAGFAVIYGITRVAHG